MSQSRILIVHSEPSSLALLTSMLKSLVPVIEEAALFDALKNNRIGGAIIDTWYTYPTPTKPNGLPSALPFHTLGNLVLTPHMSGWTDGTVRRRQQTIADNINRLAKGANLVNVV